MSVIILTVDEVMRTLSSDGQYPFVVHDKEVDIVRFAINSGFADIVLDGQVALRVMYQRPGETEVRAQTLTYYDTDGLRSYYDWHLLSADLAEKGTLNCALCILRTDSEVEEWHTTPCQVRVLDTIHTDDSDEGDETITPTVAQRVAVLETMIQRVASGAPIVVASASDMTDTSQIYVLSTDRYWYYYNGTAWVAGGEYGAVATDTTLTRAGIPADAKGVGDAISEAKTDVPKIATPEEPDVDLYICDDSGNVIAEFSDGHIKTKNFDSSDIDVDSPIKESSKTEADLYICDSFGNVIAEFKDGNIATKNFDSGDYTDTLDNIESLLTDVSDLKTATSGIVYRNRDVTDGVYAACRYHQPSLSAKQFCMLIAGDIHTDPTRMQSMIKYLNAVDAFDCGIMLGDISGNTFNDPITYYADAIAGANKPYLTVLGNHDVANGATSDADLWGKYGSLFEYADLSNGELVSGKCYYHKDFATYKIRLIVLMQYDYIYDGGLCFGQTQIDWLIQTLISTPSDYGVIICEHTDPSRNMTYNMDAAYTSDTWRRSNYAPTYMVGNPIPDIVNAWINGSTLTKTYSYTFSNAPADLFVSADFSSRGTGEFITYLGGHWHMDVLGHPTEYANQPDYHVPAAGLSAATQGDIPRRSGTLSEDSFCAIGIDRDKKIVKVFHIGAYRTKDAIDRQYFKYSYGWNNT